MVKKIPIYLKHFQLFSQTAKCLISLRHCLISDCHLLLKVAFVQGNLAKCGDEIFCVWI